MLKFSIIALTAFTSLAVAGCQTMNGNDDDHDGQEQSVTMEQLPAAVRATLTKEAGTGKIEEIDKHMDGGRTEYEADVLIDGKKWEICIREDGQLLKKELDEEKDDEDKRDDD